MARIPLLGDPYAARSVIAGAQRCVNLYAEANPPESQAPVPVTHYLTPGLEQLGEVLTAAGWRAQYTASNGALYGVCGPDVIYIDPLWEQTVIGQIADSLSRPSFSDNGLAIVIVDGSPDGYTIEMSTNTFGQIADPAFYGADKVDFLDGYFIFNRPGTPQFYISLAYATYAMLTGGSAFDPLDIAAKAGGADPIVSLAVVRKQLLLIGSLTSEFWTNTGAADFTFAPIPGAFFEHGCVAKYSVTEFDDTAYWLSADRQGHGIVVKTEGYAVKRVSLHRIEQLIQSYPNISDAIGGAYQQQGHAFFVLTFVQADRTWQREVETGNWNEWASFDNNGIQHRHRSNCWVFAYGKNVVGDFSNGKIYNLNPDVYTDDGQHIVRIRSIPHIVNDGNRFTVSRLQADMEVGAPLQTLNPDNIPKLTLRISRTRGASWEQPLMQNMGGGGAYLTSILWTRIGGDFRDAVFELEWSGAFRTALNGIWIDTIPAKT